MRFLLGFGLGLLTPLIFRAWLKTSSPKIVQELQREDGGKSEYKSVHEVGSQLFSDMEDTMRSEERSTEFAWPKSHGGAQGSEFHW